MSRVDWWSQTDAELLAQTEEDHYRASGPGGQKRSKTESAVRLRHRPTDVMVIANESRSQHENRARALKRLRRALAFELRGDVDPEKVRRLAARVCNGHLALPVRDPLFLPAAAVILDVFHARHARLADSAREFAMTSAGLTAFLRSDTQLWKSAQQLRQKHGQSPLR